MPKKFLISTASRTNRVGASYPSRLEQTVATCQPEDRAELANVLRAELANVDAKLAQLSEEMRREGYQRGTRAGAAWGAAFNRAAHKRAQLREALAALNP